MPVVVTFSGCPGDSDDAKHPNWVTTPWPPEFLEVLDWQWEKKAIPYWTRRGALRRRPRREGRARGASGLPRLQRRDGAEAARAPPGRTSASTSIRATSSGRAWTCRRRSARSATRSSTCTRRTSRSIRTTSRSTACIDTKSYRRMAERSWLFRSVGWGHDELEWKRIVSALRLSRLRLRDEHRARGRAGLGRRGAAARRWICCRG